MDKKQQDLNNKKVFENMKVSYAKQTMSDEAVNNMKDHIAFAKVMNRRDRRRKMAVRGMTVAAAVALLVVALPKTSPQVAEAMGSMPCFKAVVEATTAKQTAKAETKKEEVAEVEAQDISTTMAQDDERSDKVVMQKEATQPATEETKHRLSDVEITKIADQIVAEFKASVRGNERYRDVKVSYDVMASTPQYFTLKISCYQCGASGVEWAYYHTIDTENGHEVDLKDLFKEDSDYQQVISDNIKEQMREQMKEDENVSYWVDSEEGFQEYDFEKVDARQNFYLNEEGEVVICFDEGEVAPMCMGSVSFTIPKTVTEPIMK
ncbi:MAG: DUF3298 domain-containing protein [Lachnospiraceae bacterium]|jgi:hypothetical protein|nr:DUF3298 domain-containing protein [Lachnospiraceae bacterium]